MTEQFARILPATDANIHFPGDGLGSLTSRLFTAGSATITASGATITGGGNVGAAGSTGFAYVDTGHYANYTVVTAGVNGVIAVEMWLHANPALVGTVPTAPANLSLHTPRSIGGGFIRGQLERLVVRSNITGITVVSIMDASGTASETWSIPITPVPVDIDIGRPYLGAFGFTVVPTAQLSADLVFTPLRTPSAISRFRGVI